MTARYGVSDHAIVRYLERVVGVDVDKIRCEILDLCEPAMRAGAAKVKVGKLEFCLVDDTVATTQLRRPVKRYRAPNGKRPRDGGEVD